MKAIILAGGTGTRLGSLTYVVNKHLLPVGDRPMLVHGLDFVKNVGIDKLLIVTSAEYIGTFAALLDHYSEWDKKVYFAAQAKPAGIADAIRYGQDFCGDDPFLVLLGDNIINNANIPFVRNALINNNTRPMHRAHIWATELPDVRHCGVLNVDANGTPIGIEEKPVNPCSNLAIVGCYVFDKSIWDMIGTLSPSNRGEFEIVDILNFYLVQNKLLWHKYIGHWMDLGNSLQSYYQESLRLVQGDNA